MVEVVKKSKAEVEADLEKRGASISNRIEAIESALPIPSKRVRDLMGKKSLSKIGIAVAAGATVGAIFFLIRRRPGSSYRDEIDEVSSSIGREIQKNLSRGMDEQNAVTKALQKRPPVVQLGKDNTSIIGVAASQVLRQIVSALGPIIADRLVDRFKKPSNEK